MKNWLGLLAGLFVLQGTALADPAVYLIRPARVWTEGAPVHTGWVVVVQGNHIVAAGPEKSVHAPSGAQLIDLPDTTLLPGLMDVHSHLFLHPYNETSWNDQVLKEPVAYRTLRRSEERRVGKECRSR